VPAVERPQVRRFGLFELDLQAAELRRNGTRIKLQEQPFRILELLLQRPGEVVSRDELRNGLWPQDTFVDFDHSLNAAIRRLRDALGDSAENPRFVETVARRGYRFVAPVSNDNPAITLSSQTPTTSTPDLTPRSRKSWLVLGTMATILVAAVGILVLILWRREYPPQPRISQLTANPAGDRVRAAAISPDGKYLAFADETGFYLRTIEGGETHPITAPGQFRVSSAAWFPDGTHMVVALAKSGQESGLWDLSVLGGGARQIADDGFAPAISPDGKHVAFVKGSKTHQQLWMMSSDGSQPEMLAGDEGDYFGQVVWSPEGQRIAYSRGKLTYGYGIRLGIETMDLKSRSARTLSWPDGLNLPLAWSSNNHLIYCANERPPRQADSSLWSVPLDRDGQLRGAASRINTDAGMVVSLSVSADSKRLVVLKGVSQPDVYVAQLEKGGTRISPPRRLTLDDRRDFPFDWSPDGKEPIFVSDRSGKFSVYKQAIDHPLPELLVGGKDTLSQARLSPDGSQLLYLLYPGDNPAAPTVSLMRMAFAGGPPQRILQAKSISNLQCARSPALVCVYSEVTDTGLAFFTFDPVKGKGPQILQIKDELTKIYNWSLSPDGTTLAIARERASNAVVKIRLVPMNGGVEKWLTLPTLSDLSTLDWAADSKSLWAASAEEEGNALLNLDLEGHKRELWRPQTLTVGWAIPSRDGRSLALQVSSASANAWLLENF
jgi:DNA-binding winged helix-turn-helix (wHTH) protein/Tol biopolymer transport system component